MSDDTVLPLLFPAVARKKVTAAFDGGRLTSDGGVMLLAAAERRLGIADHLAGLIADPRNALFVTHSVADILRARMLGIACGYEDADDLDHLRTDPGFRLACGRLPHSGRDLCSQPTVSPWENAPTLREVVRLSYAMGPKPLDLYSRQWPTTLRMRFVATPRKKWANSDGFAWIVAGLWLVAVAISVARRSSDARHPGRGKVGEDQANHNSGRRQQTIESLHKDIALGNQYRLELIKLVMTLSSAVLAFTVSFRPSLHEVSQPWLMWVGWIGLGASVVGGMGNMYGWERFYLSYRDYNWYGKQAEGKAARKVITRRRRAGAVLQFVGFGVGVLAIAGFAALNLGHVTPPVAAK